MVKQKPEGSKIDREIADLAGRLNENSRRVLLERFSENPNYVERVVSFVYHGSEKQKELGARIVERSMLFEGPRVTAMLNLIDRLEEKGMSRLTGPLRFDFRGHWKLEKHKKGGKSIAGSRLREGWNYNLGTRNVRAGQVEGVGNVGTVAEIQIGSILNGEKHVLFPMFGDTDYEEFFSPEKKERRNEEVKKKEEDIALDELAKFGYDVSEFAPLLKDFFVRARLSQKGNDVDWLRGHIKLAGIKDKRLVRALDDLDENPRYNARSATLVGLAVRELRDRPTEGLIGDLRDDVLYLVTNHRMREARLEAKLSRPRFYPTKRTVTEDASVGEVMRMPAITFSQALGVLRAFPGMIKVRQKHNRRNVGKYFGSGQEGVAELTKAIERILPYVEKDDAEFHDAKSHERKADLILKGHYRTAKKIDEIRQLDESKRNWANLVSWTRMRNSAELFSELYSLSRQTELAKVAGEDVMGREYENDIDFKKRTGINLTEAVRRICVINPKVDLRQRGAKVASRNYNELREEAKTLEIEAEHGLVRAKDADRIVTAFELVKDYSKKPKDLEKRAGLPWSLKDLRESLGFNFNGLDQILESEYLTSEEAKKLESVVDFVSRNTVLANLTVQGLQEVKAQIEKQAAFSGKTFYDTDTERLSPQMQLSVRPSSKLGNMGIDYVDPEAIEKRVRALGESKSGKELGDDFLDKLKKISRGLGPGVLRAGRIFREKYQRVGDVPVDRSSLRVLASALEKEPEDSLVSSRVVDFVGRVYDTIYGQSQSRPDFSKYSHLDRGSLSSIKQGEAYEVIAVGDRDDLGRTFSRRQGGIGYLPWNPEKGWHADNIGRDKLMKLLEELEGRKTGVRIKVTRVK